ncbi:hypothetical protein ANCDUO_01166 [Ancylostoma duodenale]|uniref:Uncharacterized protein n=1 Tax=Ancylostoma duodenale TaxID=51022 RepID=A0A0C2DZL6_9BILA|nr:hypothetical protein ANCDUO_01166 [Ancylostoma duodenale]
MKGYKDANKLGSASAARRRMDDDYGSKDDRFHEGYVKGLKWAVAFFSAFFCSLSSKRLHSRDAGMTGMSTSMYNLAQRGAGGGYSSGFMQGYKSDAATQRSQLRCRRRQPQFGRQPQAFFRQNSSV